MSEAIIRDVILYLGYGDKTIPTLALATFLSIIKKCYTKVVNEKLDNYIKENLGKGVSQEAIRDYLISRGWKAEDIEQGFSEASSTTLNVDNNVNQNKEARKKISTKLLLVLGCSLILIVGIFAYLFFFKDQASEKGGSSVTQTQNGNFTVNSEVKIAIEKRGDILVVDEDGNVLKNITNIKDVGFEVSSGVISPDRTKIAYFLGEKSIGTSQAGKKILKIINSSEDVKELQIYNVRGFSEIQGEKSLADVQILTICNDNRHLILKEDETSFEAGVSNYTETYKLLNIDTNKLNVLKSEQTKTEISGDSQKYMGDAPSKWSFFGCDDQQVFAISEKEGSASKVNLLDFSGNTLKALEIPVGKFRFRFEPNSLRLIIISSDNLIGYKLGSDLIQKFSEEFKFSSNQGVSLPLITNGGDSLFYFLTNYNQATIQTPTSNEIRKVDLMKKETAAFYKGSGDPFALISLSPDNSKILVDKGGPGKFKFSILSTENGLIKDIPGLEGSAGDTPTLIGWYSQK